MAAASPHHRIRGGYDGLQPGAFGHARGATSVASPESLTFRIDTPFLVVEGHLVVEGEAAGEALGARPGLVLVEARQRPLADVAAWGRRGMEGKLPEMPHGYIIQKKVGAHLDEKK